MTALPLSSANPPAGDHPHLHLNAAPYAGGRLRILPGLIVRGASVQGRVSIGGKREREDREDEWMKQQTACGRSGALSTRNNVMGGDLRSFTRAHRLQCTEKESEHKTDG